MHVTISCTALPSRWCFCFWFDIVISKKRLKRVFLTLKNVKCVFSNNDAAAITKSHAAEQLSTELFGYCNRCCRSETHLRKKQANERFRLLMVITCFAVRDLAVLAVELLFTPATTYWPLNWTFHVPSEPSFELLWIKISTRQIDAFIEALYHPPNPQWQSTILLDYMKVIANELNCSYQGALVIVAGDFNYIVWHWIYYKDRLLISCRSTYTRF